MTDEDLRNAEEIDFTPYEGKPDDVAKHIEKQDDDPDPSDIVFDDGVQLGGDPVAPIEAGNGQEVGPVAPAPEAGA